MLCQRPVLLAEDNPDDAYLIRRALGEVRASNSLFVVRDGKEAIDYLSGSGRFSNRAQYPIPALLLLDLKMPRVDGIAVLAWLRAHEEIHSRLPVVLLSSWELPEETRQACEMDVQAFVVKPISYPELRERIRILKEYWLEDEAVLSR